MANPKLIFLFSGKRKSGKDYITEKLINRIGESTAVIVRLSGPLKQQYALDHSLNYEELLSSSEYKEKYRKNMIDWSEKIRNDKPSFFIDKAIEMYKGAQYPVWIISDLRRESDLSILKSRYPGKCVAIRTLATDDARQKRGWIHTQGIDDAASECGLDDVRSWDHVLDTSLGDTATTDTLLHALLQYL